MPEPTPTFPKRRPGAPPGFFAAEAAGLTWLGEAEANGGLRVVRVVSVGEDRIDLERIDQDPVTPWLAEQLGQRLAITHAAGADWFGQPPPGGPSRGFIATLPLPLVSRRPWSPHAPAGTAAAAAAVPVGGAGAAGAGDGPRPGRALGPSPASPWARFYAEHRLLPYLRAARKRGSITPADARAVDAVCQRLVDGDLAGPPEPPARIHGDLWSGNVLWTLHEPVLIDPAAHGGHRETDLAMLALFGLPHLDRVLDAYHETRPLAEGWRDRVGLHQLHPLLVHAVLFGREYGDQAGATARRYVGGYRY